MEPLQIDWAKLVEDGLLIPLVGLAAYFGKRAVKALDDKLAEIVKKLDKHGEVAAAQGKKLAVHDYRIKQLERSIGKRAGRGNRD